MIQAPGAYTIQLAIFIHFHPSLIIVGKATAYESRAPFGTPFYWQAPSLAQNGQTRVELNGSSKHSSLLKYGNDYRRKNFYSQSPAKLSDKKQTVKL